MKMHYKSGTWNARKERFAARGTILAIAVVVAGCGGAGGQASKMTSYSIAESLWLLGSALAEARQTQLTKFF